MSCGECRVGFKQQRVASLHHDLTGLAWQALAVASHRDAAVAHPAEQAVLPADDRQGVVDAVNGIGRKNRVNLRACSPDLFNGVKQYVFTILLTAAVTFVLSWAVWRLSLKYKLYPGIRERDVHKTPTPRLGVELEEEIAMVVGLCPAEAIKEAGGVTMPAADLERTRKLPIRLICTTSSNWATG